MTTNYTVEKFQQRLEERGFKRELCGEEDFNALFEAWKKAGEHSPRRGILVCGVTGCGKTHALRALYPNAFLIDCGTQRGFDLLDMGEVNGDYNDRDVLLDDIGAELPKVAFGVKRELVAGFIRDRYSALENARFRGLEANERRIFATTSQSVDELTQRYGDAVVSRFYQLFEFVVMKGKDKRGA